MAFLPKNKCLYFMAAVIILSWQRGLHNSVRPCAMRCRPTEDGRVTVKSSDKAWSTGGRNGSPLQYSCHKNPVNSMKRQKDMTPKDKSLMLEGFQHDTREEQRAITNSSRKNEATGPKQKWHSVVDVFGGESKVRCYTEQYGIGTWNVRFMNQGKLETVKQEMAKLIIDILGIGELKRMGMGRFNSRWNCRASKTEKAYYLQRKDN